jgi:biotin carboxyl carrier protein
MPDGILSRSVVCFGLALHDIDCYNCQIEDTTFSMAEYSAFSVSIAEEVAIFEAKQKQAVQQQEEMSVFRAPPFFTNLIFDRETCLLEEWELQKRSNVEALALNDEGTLSHFVRVPVRMTLISTVEGSAQITSPLFGNVWKICCQQGDIITSGDMTVAILEAMKTEIPIKAGEGNVDKIVRGFGKGIREGASVNPGDCLIVLT